jgi:hypothetical protein
MRALAILAIAVAATAARAQEVKDTGAAAQHFDETWREQEVQVPPYPNPGDLVRFDTGLTSSFEYFVDRSSVSVGASDGVVRYTVVAKSDGAMNVTYEGIRCQLRERKVYAYGRRDGTWSEARDPQWVRIGLPGADPHRYTLWKDYFCPGRSAIRTAAEGVDALKLGGHPRAADLTSGHPVAR